MDFSGYDLILTPNHRLSAVLKKSTPVYSLSQWLEKAHAEFFSSKTLLNPHRQLFLISTLMKEHFPDYAGLASLVQSAWRTCLHYKVDLESSTFDKNDDTQLFQSIAKLISKYYRKYNLMDPEHLMSQLNLPPKTGLYGFQSTTPLEQQLLLGGIAINPPLFVDKTKQSVFTDPEIEFKTMALWSAKQSKNKQIACVIPDLDAQRNKLEYYFDAILGNSTSVTFSAVKKLSDYYFIEDILELLSSHHNDLNQKPSEWANTFQHFLVRDVLTSEEYQLKEKFKEILTLYKQYDFIGKNLTHEEAIGELKILCDRTPFQIQASEHAHIHVISVLESKGLWFDAAWITGLDSRHWPRQSKPNPFLPFPHTPRVEPDFNSIANEIIYSYPLQAQDVNVIPHELLNSIPVENIILNWPMPTVGARFIAPLIDNLPVDLSFLKHHGSQIFKDHIACPFRAFAKHRLHALKVEEPQMGLNALQKGNTAHEILENIWKALQSKQNLIIVEPEKLILLVNKIINNSLKKFDKTVQPIFIRAEKSRLEKLALDWLELEKSRENFTVIATEEVLETGLGHLPLKLRIDRIDKIGENKYLIIDYKTSQYDIRGDYLDEPQLPLYAVVSGKSVDKIAYAYLRTGNSKLKEIPVGDLKQQWESELLKIADDFLKGNAEVKPKYGEETCRMCDLHSLCRIKSFPSEHEL
ncbi:MAG: PD-(D/E)XK nuclease family protein [Gammaproteobacteria bacterium]|nr:PD-(D/E)XK nuclease family protein [Gammaproteobacteria bacterium]